MLRCWLSAQNKERRQAKKKTTQQQIEQMMLGDDQQSDDDYNKQSIFFGGLFLSIFLFLNLNEKQIDSLSSLFFFFRCVQNYIYKYMYRVFIDIL